jgi:hypothetical protein
MTKDPEDYKYVLYACTNNGEGFCEEVGRYDDVDEIRIRTGMFDKDVVITISKDYEKD